MRYEPADLIEATVEACAEQAEGEHGSLIPPEGWALDYGKVEEHARELHRLHVEANAHEGRRNHDHDQTVTCHVGCPAFSGAANAHEKEQA